MVLFSIVLSSFLQVQTVIELFDVNADIVVESRH